MTQETAARSTGRFPFRQRMWAIAWPILRGLLPFPDLIRRHRVRSQAGKLITCSPWPGLDAAGPEAAQLALLRLLWLQRQTRRAVRGRHREASVLLARASLETCILGLWCLQDETAVAALQAANVRALRNMAAWLTDEALVPADVMAKCVATLGQPGPVPKVADMAKKVDQEIGGNGATSLYRKLYVPASNLFTHANAGSLLRHVSSDGSLTRHPGRAWTRRAPARAADAAVGILASNIVRRRGTPDVLFARYASAHLDSTPPPITVIAGISYGRSLSPRHVLSMIKSIKALGAYTWSEQAAIDSADVRKASIRQWLGTALNLPELGIPDDAAEAYIDYLAASIAGDAASEAGNP